MNVLIYTRKRFESNTFQKRMSFLLFSGKESNRAYSYAQEEIKILTKEGVVKPMSDCVDYPLPPGGIEKYYLCYASNLKEKRL